MGNFDIDLKFGEGFEKKVRNILKTNGNTIEVKTERAKWQETGNIAIEMSYYGKKSGLMTTDASWWFHILADGDKIVSILVFPVIELRIMVDDLLKKGDAKLVRGGDYNASEIALIPINSVYKMSICSVINSD